MPIIASWPRTAVRAIGPFTPTRAVLKSPGSRVLAAVSRPLGLPFKIILIRFHIDITIRYYKYMAYNTTFYIILYVIVCIHLLLKTNYLDFPREGLDLR